MTRGVKCYTGVTTCCTEVRRGESALVSTPTVTQLVTIRCVTGNEEAGIERMIADQKLVGVSGTCSHATPQSIDISTLPIVTSSHYGLVNLLFEIHFCTGLIIDKHNFSELKERKNNNKNESKFEFVQLFSVKNFFYLYQFVYLAKYNFDLTTCRE